MIGPRQEPNCGAQGPAGEPFAAFLADAPIACHEIDRSGRVVKVNDAECRLLEIRPEEMLGRPVWEFVAPGQREESRAAVEAKLAGRQPLLCFEREYVRPGGEKLVLEIREAFIRNSEGHICGIRSFLADATERMRAQQALVENERRLKHLIENATDIVYQADIHGRFTFVNPTAERILSFPIEKLVGMHYLDLIRPDWRPRAHRFYRRQFVDQIPNTYLEFPTLDAHGSEVWFGQNVQLVFEQGRLTGFQAIARDITAPKHAEDVLRHVQEELERRVAERTSELAETAASLRREMEERQIAEEERRRFEAQMQHVQRLESLGVLAGGLAHDFNNLLTTIVGYTALVLMDLPPNSPAVEGLKEVENAANRAADLVQKMLAYSGKGRLVIEPVRLSDVIHDLRNFFDSMVSKKADLKLTLDPALPEINADPGQLRQILINLVANASEALEDRPGEIRIATGVTWASLDVLSASYVRDLPEGQYVFLEISDTGCGMDTESKAKVFDPFYSTKFTGRGLGMAAVLGIVRSHRGTIELQSEPGAGTTFRILLPVARPEPRAPEAGMSEPAASRASGTVLIAEDELPVQALARKVLKRAGLSVLTAGNGEQALAIATSLGQNLRAVLLDLTMPGLNGEEVLVRLRESGLHVPVVVCSGYSEQEVSTRIRSDPATLFLQKPYTPLQLLSVVKRALKQNRG